MEIVVKVDDLFINECGCFAEIDGKKVKFGSILALGEHVIMTKDQTRVSLESKVEWEMFNTASAALPIQTKCMVIPIKNTDWEMEIEKFSKHHGVLEGWDQTGRWRKKFEAKNNEMTKVLRDGVFLSGSCGKVKYGWSVRKPLPNVYVESVWVSEKNGVEIVVDKKFLPLREMENSRYHRIVDGVVWSRPFHVGSAGRYEIDTFLSSYSGREMKGTTETHPYEFVSTFRTLQRAILNRNDEEKTRILLEQKQDVPKRVRIKDTIVMTTVREFLPIDATKCSISDLESAISACDGDFGTPASDYRVLVQPSIQPLSSFALSVDASFYFDNKRGPMAHCPNDDRFAVFDHHVPLATWYEAIVGVVMKKIRDWHGCIGLRFTNTCASVYIGENQNIYTIDHPGLVDKFLEIQCSLESIKGFVDDCDLRIKPVRNRNFVVDVEKPPSSADVVFLSRKRTFYHGSGGTMDCVELQPVASISTRFDACGMKVRDLTVRDGGDWYKKRKITTLTEGEIVDIENLKIKT